MKYVFYNKLKSIYNKNNQITNAKNILDKQTERPLLNQNRIMLKMQLIMKVFLKQNTVRDQSLQLLSMDRILKVVIKENTSSTWIMLFLAWLTKGICCIFLAQIVLRPLGRGFRRAYFMTFSGEACYIAWDGLTCGIKLFSSFCVFSLGTVCA